MTHGLDGPVELRLAELGQRLDSAADVISTGVPHAAHDVRVGLAALRDRLRRVHVYCDEIDDRTWTAYTDGLDRGLADLASDLTDDAPVDDVVYAHTGRLEVDGWVLRLDLAGRDAPVEGRELIAGAVKEIDDYRIAVTKGGAPSRTDVERALSELRGAVD